MKKLTLSLAAVLTASSLVSTVSAADDKSGFNIFDDVKVKGEIRPRYEHADNSDDTTTDPANAMTARTLLGLNAKLFQVEGLSTYLEGTSVNNFGYTKYNDKAGQGTKYDVILDPQQARMTQAYIDYKLGKTLIRAGRQLVNIDDQRFVGAVGWRQMFQTFDAISVVDNSVENLNILASYVYGSMGVGAQNMAGDTNTILLNAKYKVMPELVVTGYSYLLADIHDTYGVRANGKVALAKDMAVTYDASYAMQRDATLDYDGVDNAKIDASYYNISVDANLSGVIVGADYEVLGKGGSGSLDGFSTPLATLHKFNGWADVFLGQTATSNTTGLVDMNAKVGYKAKGFGKALAIFHKFSTNTKAATDLGTELDLLYANKIKAVKGLSGLVKGAYYSKGDTGSDRTVAWLMLDYKFKTK